MRELANFIIRCALTSIEPFTNKCSNFLLLQKKKPDTVVVRCSLFHSQYQDEEEEEDTINLTVLSIVLFKHYGACCATSKLSLFGRMNDVKCV